MCFYQLEISVHCSEKSFLQLKIYISTSKKYITTPIHLNTISNQIYTTPINICISQKICFKQCQKQFLQALYMFPLVGTLVSATGQLVSKCNRLFCSRIYIMVFLIETNVSSSEKICFHQQEKQFLQASIHVSNSEKVDLYYWETTL